MMNADEMTGYPSIDKPWLKYYSSEAISGELPPKRYTDTYTIAMKKIWIQLRLNTLGKK